MSGERHSNFLEKCGFVQFCTFEVLSLFLLQCGVFQSKKPILGGNPSISVSSIKLSVTSLTGRNANAFQPVETKLLTTYLIFYGKIALRSISFMAEMFAAKMLGAKISMAKMLMGKVPRTT